MKRVKKLAIAAVFVLALTGLLWADGVLPIGDAAPGQVVAARKDMMRAMKLNMGDVGSKFEAGAVDAIPANAAALEIMGRVMPPLYRERHKSAYTGKGKYFTGGDPAGFEAAAEKFRLAAQKVLDGAKSADKDAVAAAMGELGGSCGACHKAYRGSF